MSRILIVDDDRDILQAAKMYLKRHFYRVDTEVNPNTIPDYLERTGYDAVLLDMNFTEDVSSGREGYKWLQRIHEIDSSVAVVLITAYGDVEKAVKAIKMGASDFVVKPWQNEKLLATINSALNLTESRREANKLRSRQQQLNDQIDEQYEEMIGQSSAMKNVFETIEKVADTPANVLITGENGTGKELAAHAIHRRSIRSDDIFIRVDIGSISENLFESELFGHTKGAFTDAKEARAGRFEAADGGTLFLDEIGNLPLGLQTKLLSAIENKKTTRIGSNKAVDVDIRLICATNQPIGKLKDEKHFRRDLLYRINTIHIEMPSLRDRRNDILLLARYFMQKFSKKYEKKIQTISQSAMKEITQYEWPGNVRELQHAVERAVIMADSPILKTQDLLMDTPNEGDETSEIDNLNLEDVEKGAIEKALNKHERNISRTADDLGLSRAALYRRIEKYDL